MSIRPAPTAASGGQPPGPRGFQGIAPVSDGDEETRTSTTEAAGGRMHGIGHLSYTSENPAAQPRLFRARGQRHLSPTGRPRAGEATHRFSGRAEKETSDSKYGICPCIPGSSMGPIRHGIRPPRVARRLARIPRLPVDLPLLRLALGATSCHRPERDKPRAMRVFFLRDAVTFSGKQETKR